MEGTPDRPHRFTLRVEAEAALLYDRAAHQYFQLSAAEAFLLVASQEEPAGAAVQRLDGAVGKKEAREALAALRGRGELGPDGERFPGRVLHRPTVPGAWSAPLVCHLGVTLACNFACHHCYSSSGKRAPGELSAEDIERLVMQLAEVGCQKLVLGGGEPFLRKDLPRLVRFADAQGVDTFIHTNGSLLGREALEALAACPPAGLALSLDGPDTETNDAIRGPRAFVRALKGVEALRAHYPPGFNVSVTITPKNALAAPRMVELAHQLGARVLLLRPAYPAGEAQAADGVVCDRDTFARAVDLARSRAKALEVTLDAPHPHEAGVPDFDGFGCVAARVVLGVDPQGDVTPCLNLPDEFLSGNVKDKSVEALWRGGKAFVAVRAQGPNPQCASCRHYDTCRGGCRVRSLFVGNGLGGPDSWCHYEPKVKAGRKTKKPTEERRT